MSFTRDYSILLPVDHTLNANWPGYDRNAKQDVQDRLADIISGFNSGETVKGVLNLPFIAVSKPSTVTDQIQLYGKVVAGKTELHAVDEDGNEFQITTLGALNLPTAVLLTGDQTVAGVKTFSSIPVLPGSDPSTSNQAARKAYVDTKSSFGTVQTGKTVDTIYQAATDGCVFIAIETVAGQGNFYSDSSNPPTTLRGRMTGAAAIDFVVSIPVKALNYYKLTVTSTYTLRNYEFWPKSG